MDQCQKSCFESKYHPQVPSSPPVCIGPMVIHSDFHIFREENRETGAPYRKLDCASNINVYTKYERNSSLNCCHFDQIVTSKRSRSAIARIKICNCNYDILYTSYGQIRDRIIVMAAKLAFFLCLQLCSSQNLCSSEPRDLKEILTIHIRSTFPRITG